MEPFKTVKSRRVEATRRNKRPTMFGGAVDCREHVHARRRLGQVVLASGRERRSLRGPRGGLIAKRRGLPGRGVFRISGLYDPEGRLGIC